MHQEISGLCYALLLFCVTQSVINRYNKLSLLHLLLCGNDCMFFFTDSNHLYGCGWNKYKQLQDDAKEDYFSFTFLRDFSDEEVIQLKAGPWNSAVLCK